MTETHKSNSEESAALKEETDQLEAKRREELKEREAEKAKQEAAKQREGEGEQKAKELAETEEEVLAGKLQNSYLEKSREISAEITRKDRDTLKNSTIEDVRFNPRLLIPTKKTETNEQQFANIKEETRRRIKAYTKEFKDDWYTLDYEQMGTDKNGFSHEINIGLGDILLDPDIKEILVLKGDKIIKGHRGKYKNRIAFLDDNGNYLATFTNDKFRILGDDETDQNNPRNLQDYVQKLNEETRQRKIDHEKFKREKSPRPFPQHYNPNRETQYAIELDSNSENVVDQIKIGLNPQQRANALIIEEEFRRALANILPEPGLSNAIAAAIVNANAESTLVATIIGDSGNSVGLFQLHIKGLGHGMSVQARQDPTTNTRTILEKGVLSGEGMNFLSAARRGASVAELAAIFCRDIEQPADTTGGMNKRYEMAYDFFGRERSASEKKTIMAKQDLSKYKEKFKTRDGLPATADLQGGQDRWIFGSSSTVGLEGLQEGNTGTFGITGAGPKSFLASLQEKWDKIGTLVPPRHVILYGLNLNGLRAKGDPIITAQKEIEEHLKIVKFLNDHGIKDIRIASTHEYTAKVGAIRAFNELLAKNYPQYYLGTPIESGELHLSKNDRRKITKFFESVV